MTEIEANTADSDDAALIARVATGDEEAFVELYRRRQPDVYRFAFAMSRSTVLAQDVAQDVFVELLQDASGFDPAKGSVRAWLLGSARYRVLDRLRRDGRFTNVLPEEAAVQCTGEESVLAKQRLEKLHAAIVDLPFEFREAIVLCELSELSYAESAAVLGCPLGTIRSRLHRAKALLALRLGDLRAAPAPHAARAATTQSAAAAPAAVAAPVLTTSEVCS